MRLTAIEKPKGLVLKLAYYLSKKRFGKVLSVLKYIHSKSIPVLMASYKIVQSEKKLSLPEETQLFIRYYTSHLNDCPFCANTIEFRTAEQHLEFEQWKEFMNFRNSPKFTDKQKALLAYLEEVNLTKAATDETFAELKRFFSEKEIVEITWVNATENCFNLMAKPLGLRSDELAFKK